MSKPLSEIAKAFVASFKALQQIDVASFPTDEQAPFLREMEQHTAGFNYWLQEQKRRCASQGRSSLNRHN